MLIPVKEAAIYEKLAGSAFYPDIYETGDSFILMEYIKGETFYNCLKKGIAISDDMIQQLLSLDIPEKILSAPFFDRLLLRQTHRRFFPCRLVLIPRISL